MASSLPNSPLLPGGWRGERGASSRSCHLTKAGRIGLRLRLACVRHERVRRQKGEGVFPGPIPSKLADRGSGEPGKDLRGLAVVVVVSEYVPQSCSQSVGYAPESL